ncbi:MAG: T9SS type A sorting domain-containing protein [Fibrobacteres bacterium]|nr:T9SS type A sorting domain-containing protein [Fibrobacterota bacterium]
MKKLFFFTCLFSILVYSIPLFESTPNNISVVLPFDSLGLTTRPSSSEIEYRIQGESAWRKGHRLLSTRYENALTPSDNFLSTSLFNLQPDTIYEIRISILKQNGQSYNLLRSVRTGKNKWSSGLRNIYVDSKTGDDNRSGLSRIEAKRTISAAIRTPLLPGDIIHIANGRYFEELFLDSINGENGKEILFEGEGDSVFLEGYDSSFKPVSWQDTGKDSGGNPVYSAPLNICPDGGWVHGASNQMMEGMLYQYHSTNSSKCNTLADLYKNSSSVNRLGAFYHDSAKGKVYFTIQSDYSPDTLNIVFSSRKTCIRARYSSHIVFRNLNIQHGGYYGLSLEGCNHIRVTKCNFRYHKSAVCTNNGIPNFKATRKFYVWQGDTFTYWNVKVDSVKEGHLSNFCAIESSFVTAPKAWAWNTANAWSFMHDDEFTFARHHLNGIDASYAGTGWVIKNCRFKDLFNGLYISQNGERNKLWDPRFFRNFDFCNNELIKIADDCVEPEGAAVNLRIYNNRFNYFRNGFSDAPTTIGPLFFMRNILTNWFEGAVKAKDAWEYDYGIACIYHNTFYFGDERYSHGGAVNGSSDFNDIYMNNILSSIYSPYNGTEGITRTQNIQLDYNSYYCSSALPYIVFEDTSFTSLAQANAAGFELHGIFNTGKQRPLFTGTAKDTPVVQLTFSSSEIDRGAVIPGINDGYLGNGPDIGAVEWVPLISAEFCRGNIDNTPVAFATPNPFNGSITLGLKLPLLTKKYPNITLSVYNIAGQLVFGKSINNPANLTTIKWHSDIENAAALYFSKWSFDNKIIVTKLLRVK